MTRQAFMLLAVCSALACAGSQHTKVLVPYRLTEPVGPVVVEAENATGNALPLPPAGVIEQAVRIIVQRPEPESTIAEAFGRAIAERLAQLHVPVAAPAPAAARRLRVSLQSWDLRDPGAVGAVVVVSATYQLLDERGGMLWTVEQRLLPVRLTGPNLSRHEIEHVARSCVDLALASLPAS